MKKFQVLNSYATINNNQLVSVQGGKKKRLLTPYNLGRFAGTVNKYGLIALRLLK